VQVTVLDQNGNLVTGGEFQINLELIGNNNGKLKGDDRETTRTGVATFQDLEVDEEGEYLLRASADGLSSANSNAFEVHKRNDDRDD
jgi:hypothetical protein